MFFEKVYKPIPLVYNLVLAMLWRHPENVELEKIKFVHYCAAVSRDPFAYQPEPFTIDDEIDSDPSHGDVEEIITKSTILASVLEPEMTYVPAPSTA
ncbi:unnamed protein product [Brassica oleracea var. botrytis]|uniref:Hexosyltransferase n=3 Tax=Brassica TaxID=3705 RepID=A0A3P6EW66_BRAOL|nr:unnamed protein product [Brassica napus]CDY09529.1 BnaC05g23900D [Brassica napus]VDD44188.1 unnamed protein product [Brassica oleracea]